MIQLVHQARQPADAAPSAGLAVDLTLGVVAATVNTGATVVRVGWKVAGPVSRVAWRPPLLPQRYQPAALAAGLARTGHAQRALAGRRLGELLDTWAPPIVEAVLRRLDLTLLVTQSVRLDDVVAAVDLDRAVARVDLDAIIDRLDLDGIVAGVDLEPVIRRIDVDAIAAGIDLDAIIDRIDVDAIAAGIDLDAVIGRIDLVGLAEEIIDAVDLPAIIRDSTGSMASETVRGVRMSGINADEAISRVVDRHRLRRRFRRLEEGQE